MSVALILKAKGTHVETTRPDTTLYLVKHRLDELELETNVLRENLMTGH